LLTLDFVFQLRTIAATRTTPAFVLPAQVPNNLKQPLPTMQTTPAPNMQADPATNIGNIAAAKVEMAPESPEIAKYRTEDNRRVYLMMRALERVGYG
jgi:hypothetical protein